MGVMRISAAFGIERRFNRCQARAQPLQHRLERAVRPHAQAVGKNLHRHVPVAEVPGNPRQVRQVVAANLDQRLRLDHHVDDAAVVEFKRVPIAQENSLGKHRADLSAVHAGEMPGLQAALVRLENDGVDLARAAARRMHNANDAQHQLSRAGRSGVLVGTARLHRLVTARGRRRHKRGVRLLIALVREPTERQAGDIEDACRRRAQATGS